MRRSGTTENGRRGPCCSFCNMVEPLLMFDIFAKKPELRLPSGKSRYETLIGCMSTLVLVGAVGFYGYMSFKEGKDRKQDYIIHSEVEDFFDPLLPYPDTEKDSPMVQDFQIAFGMAEVGYPGDLVTEENGSVQAFYRTWDYSLNTNTTETADAA